ncbi:MAG: elongation factor P [Candidatus Omnitrophota bacterium]|nr:MAG: elongation factor P [Candidatus Omnitrophota bacterium]
MSISDLRPSISICYNNDLYLVCECEHAKIARGNAFCRVKLKSLRTSQIIDCTLRNSDNIEEAFIEQRQLQYLYHDGDIYHFLDLGTYEDLILNKSCIEDKVSWFKDHLEMVGLFYNGKLINLELPYSLELKVVETEPGFRGDTVKAGTKPAKLETDVYVQVPLFINIGDVVKVDTRTGEYLGRA